MGAASLCSYTFLPLPLPKLGISSISFKEKSDRLAVSCIKDEENKSETASKNPIPRITPLHKGSGDDFQSMEGRKSFSPNKEEILAVFKRIQSSISKGQTVNSEKRISNPTDDISAAESIFAVLRQSGTQGQGRTVGKRRDTPRSNSPRKVYIPKQHIVEKLQESSLEPSPAPASNFSRKPSNFTRRSPIPALSSPRDKGAEPTSETARSDSSEGNKVHNFEEMKLAELKEVAKSKGIRGYSKLKKNELVDLLIRS